jgi:hypothetical protein
MHFPSKIVILLSIVAALGASSIVGATANAAPSKRDSATSSVLSPQTRQSKCGEPDGGPPWVGLYKDIDWKPQPQICFQGAGLLDLQQYRLGNGNWANQISGINISANGTFYAANRDALPFYYGMQYADLRTIG